MTNVGTKEVKRSFWTNLASFVQDILSFTRGQLRCRNHELSGKTSSACSHLTYQGYCFSLENGNKVRRAAISYTAVPYPFIAQIESDEELQITWPLVVIVHVRIVQRLEILLALQISHDACTCHRPWILYHRAQVTHQYKTLCICNILKATARLSHNKFLQFDLDFVVTCFVAVEEEELHQQVAQA